MQCRPQRLFTLLREQFDLLRAIAFAIVEGASGGEIRPVIGGDPILLVPVGTFMQSASSEDRALRDAPGHDEARVVCCDPSPGALARRLGKAKFRPSRLLGQGMVDGEGLVGFSKQATELTAERARGSIRLLTAFMEEFEDLNCEALVKLGYPTDSHGESSCEHLRFRGHSVGTDSVDATLLNEPFDIAAMLAGERRTHSLERLSDWLLFTPAGQLTPRSLHLARVLRELRSEIVERLAATPRSPAKPN